MIIDPLLCRRVQAQRGPHHVVALGQPQRVMGNASMGTYRRVWYLVAGEALPTYEMVRETKCLEYHDVLSLDTLRNKKAVRVIVAFKQLDTTIYH